MNQTAEEIKRVAMEFDNAIEARDVEGMLAAFADDCEIELLGITVHCNLDKPRHASGSSAQKRHWAFDDEHQ